MLRTGQFKPQLKLLYHTEKIQDWLGGINIQPILVEFDLSNACNHRCNFCTFDYIKDKSILKKSVVLNTINEFTNVKAINWTGGGEPTIHKDFVEIIEHTHKRGIKQGLFTNGSLLTTAMSKAILSTHEWVRISLDSSNAKMFSDIRGVDQFDKVITNVHELVYLKEKYGYKAEIGLGFVITQENYKGIPEFAELVKRTGVDYGQLKPCINNFLCNWQMESEWWGKKVIPLVTNAVRSYKNIVVNDYKFKELLEDNVDRGYEKCYGHIFCPCIGATGDVWLCTHMRDIQEYSLGNLYDLPFKSIWDSKRRREVIDSIDFGKCQFCCKNHEINKALYAIKHEDTRHHGDFL